MRPEWRQPKPRRGRRLLVIGGVAVATLTIAVVVGLLVVYPQIGAAQVRDNMIPKLAKKIGHPVTVEGVDVSLGRAVLTNIVIIDESDGSELAVVPKLVLEFGVGPSLFGRVELDTLVVHDARLLTTIAKDGSSPWDQLRSSLAARTKDDPVEVDGEIPVERSGLTPRLAELRNASFELRDERRGVTAVGDGLTATFEGGKLGAKTARVTVMSAVGPRAELVDVSFSGRVRELSETAELEIGDGSLVLWPGMTLTGISGTIAPASTSESLFIDLGGGWGGSEGRVWKAVGKFDPRTKQGDVRIAAERFELKRIANVLGETPLRNIEETSIGAELKIVSDGEKVSVNGAVEVDKLSLFHPRLAGETIEKVSLSGELEASYSLATSELQLPSAVLRSGGVEYQLDGMFRLGATTFFDEVHFRLKVPPVRCQTVLDSMPAALIPKLQGFELSGKFDTDLEVHVRWDDLENSLLKGAVGIRKCKVVKPAKGMSARKIKSQFRHRIIVGFDDDEPIYRRMTVGPSNSNYVSFQSVSPYLINSLLTTEDSSFFRHRGFIVSEFRTAMIKNLEAGYFRYGASSITMQLAKNVYLDRAKTVSRKLQELFMTWYIETQVKKERLIEVYINAIEYGPKLYGIGHAASRYFGKSAADLNPNESAFISTILPAPARRYKQFCRDQLSGWTERKIERILGLMLKRKRITEEEYERAMITPLYFRSEKVGCRGH